MCIPAAALPLVAAIGAGVSAVGTGFAALQASQQARFQAKVAEQNAALERNAAQQERLNAEQTALDQYRKGSQIEGRQRVAAAAGGISPDFGTPADIVGDTRSLVGEDVGRIYQQSDQRIKGYDINASNYMGQANADRQAATGALIKGGFDVAGTVLGGVTQYNRLNTIYGRK